MTDLLQKCPVCQALLDEEDLFCPNCGTEAPAHEARTADASRAFTYNFRCSGCGASMSYDASAGQLRCPFCGSEDLAKQADAKTISPTSVVPFVVTRDEAVAKMRAWLDQGFWRPGDLRQQALLVAMTPVFVPYWVFQANTHTFWTADTSQTPRGAMGNWFPLFGEHHGQHLGLLVAASGALAPAETTAISPFDLSKGVKPDGVDLDNITVEQFALGRKYARPLARSGLEVSDSSACQKYVPGRCRNMKVNVQLEGLSSEPVLLPVWIMAYRYRDRVFRFLLNGQSGAATGQAPVSYAKIAFAVGLAIAIAAVVALIALSRR
jgi:DNA-directed RNA polymerase subunit RPC12/RpoP